jgi:NCS2 family nucleobase:cation symporter-2
VCSWFSYVFTYDGPNRSLLGFFNAIELIMQTGFALAAFVTLILNLVLPEEIEDEETPELTANHLEEDKDSEEWERIRKGSHAVNKETGDGVGVGVGVGKPEPEVAEGVKV